MPRYPNSSYNHHPCTRQIHYLYILSKFPHITPSQLLFILIPWALLIVRIFITYIWHIKISTCTRRCAKISSNKRRHYRLFFAAKFTHVNSILKWSSRHKHLSIKAAKCVMARLTASRKRTQNCRPKPHYKIGLNKKKEGG